MVLIVTENRYPGGDAGSLRIREIGRVLLALNQEVFVVGNGAITSEVTEADDIRYVSLRTPNRVRSYLSLPYRTLNYTRQLCAEHNVTHIIAECVRASTLILLKRFCKKQDIALIYDVVEWYSPSQFKWPYLNPAFIDKTLVNKMVIDKSVRVISISRYLDEYFKAKNVQSVRVPIFFEQKLMGARPLSFEKINITYAGSPGNKDFLWLMLRAFAALNEDIRNKMNFNIVGCNEEQIKDICGKHGIDYQGICRNLSIYGRVPHRKVIEVLGSTHFTFLLRDAGERYAKAGFPSKVVESVSNGVPVILNFSSDLELYLSDDINCIVVEDLSIGSICQSLTKAANISPERYEQMSTNAKDTANTHFNTMSYIGEIKSILQ